MATSRDNSASPQPASSASPFRAAPSSVGSKAVGSKVAGSKGVTYWRVEGSLLELGALRPVLFFTWNSRSYAERWARRLGMAGMGLVRPLMYAGSRPLAARVFDTLLRGGS